MNDKYTAEQIDTFILNTSKYLGVAVSEMLTEYAALLRERESASARVPDASWFEKTLCEARNKWGDALLAAATKPEKE